VEDLRERREGLSKTSCSVIAKYFEFQIDYRFKQLVHKTHIRVAPPGRENEGGQAARGADVGVAAVLEQPKGPLLPGFKSTWGKGIQSADTQQCSTWFMGYLVDYYAENRERGRA
jgi:hypothetical protein